MKSNKKILDYKGYLSRKFLKKRMNYNLGRVPIDMSLTVQDTGSKVQLMLKAHGLRKRHSLFNSIITHFKKVRFSPKVVIRKKPVFEKTLKKTAFEAGGF